MTNLLVDLGKIAGIAGIGIGAATLVFRDVIRKKIFPKLPPEHAYRLLRLIVVFAWSIALVGIILWQAPIIIFGNSSIYIKDTTIQK